MSFSDFMRSFDSVEMCHLTIDSFSAELAEPDNVENIHKIFRILFFLFNLFYFVKKDDNLMWKCKTYKSRW
jgi:hypothetical protein